MRERFRKKALRETPSTVFSKFGAFRCSPLHLAYCSRRSEVPSATPRTGRTLARLQANVVVGSGSRNGGTHQRELWGERAVDPPNAFRVR